jgi:hypothetical protein
MTDTNQTYKKPPMAKASREFLVAMQFPPAPKHGPNPNIKLAALFGAMMFHCSGVKENAETVTCSPSQRQIADLLHSSIKAVERLMQKAQSIGLLTSRRRGDGLSSVYTIHKAPQTRQLLSEQQTRQLLTGLKSSRPDNSQGSDQTTLDSDQTTLDSDPTTVVVLRGNASGLSQEKPFSGTTSIVGQADGLVFSETPQTSGLNPQTIPQTKLPEGWTSREVPGDEF